MSARDAIDPAFMPWERVWALFDKDEQRDVLGAYWDAWHDGEIDEADVARVLQRLSKAHNHRRDPLRRVDWGRMVQPPQLRGKEASGA